ncbi:MAG: nucleotidyltransferase family protein [Vicinamibacterales bacterium]
MPLPHIFAAENQLLTTASRIDGGPANGPDVRELSWEYVLRAADRQGVAALLHRWLAQRPGLAVPDGVREQLHDTYWRGHFRNRLLLEELGRVNQAASAQGILPMPLKGALLAPEYYDASALRPLSDLDLLVHPRDVAAFGAVLQSMGYTETAPSPSYVDSERLDLDSHDHCWFASRQGFDAFIEFRVAPLELAVGRLTDLDPAYTDALRRHARDVWARAATTVDGVAVRQSPEDLLLHVATHLAAKHLDFRLIWLHDLALILRRHALDWTYISEHAHQLRMAAPIVAALEAARTYVGAPVTDAQVAQLIRPLRPGAWFSLTARDLAQLRHHVSTLPKRDLTQEGPWGWPLGSALSRVQRWPARLRMVRWVLLPGREYLKHRGAARSGRLSGSLLRLLDRWRRKTGVRR